MSFHKYTLWLFLTQTDWNIQQEKFLYKIPNNIMGLPWFQLKTVVDTEAPERFRQSKASTVKAA